MKSQPANKPRIYSSRGIQPELNFHICEFFQGDADELRSHFINHQSRFLQTMIDEVLCTLDNGIEEMKQLQMSCTHEVCCIVLGKYLKVACFVKIAYFSLITCENMSDI